MKQSIALRFKAKTKRFAGGCIGWTAAKNNKGYGRILVGKGAKLAHRVSWQLANGDIPKGKFVLHRCDNPICVNVKHLFLGTQKDNIEDMVRKGRHGKRHGRLSADLVRKVREDFIPRKFTGMMLAAKYHLPLHEVQDITSNKRYLWVK